MSILIKGMEMPISCEECDFRDYEEGSCLALHDEIRYVPWEKREVRQEWCPLVEIPPHGELIDRDIVYNFAEVLDDNKLLAVSGMAFAFLKAKIKDVPTVIEAEGRENE